MQVRNTLLATILLAPGLLSATAAMSDEAAVVRGVALMEAGRFDEAQRELRSSMESDSSPQDRGRALFYLGLNEQKRARTLPTGPGQQGALQLAAKFYRSALLANPKSGGALNNLAQVQADLGDLEAANATLEQAIALGDGRQALYQSTRARLLSAGPLDARALKALFAAAAAAPDDVSARTRLVRAAAQAHPGLIHDLATRLLAKGYASAAEDVCVQGFEAVPELRKPLLVLLALALAAQTYEPLGFAKVKAPTMQALQRLLDDGTAGRGARELIALHVEPKGEYAAYRWWTETYNEHALPTHEAPYQALRALAIRLGDWYRRIGTPDALWRAEPYALLAVQLSGSNVDPTAILGLAEIYANTNQQGKLRQVSDQYAGSLFQGKAGAYARANDEEIYQFHLALGTIYGYLDQWQNPQWSPASAIFQLEHARQAADRLNRRTPDCGANCVTVPPKAIELLATGYERTGRVEESVRVAVEAADTYIKNERPQLAVEVIENAEAKALPPEVTEQTKEDLRTVRERALEYQVPKE